MRSLRLIGTGGTISCKPSGDGLAPAFNAQGLLEFIEYDASNVDCEDLFALDSSNIQPEEWREIAQAIHEHVDKYLSLIHI